MTRHTLRIAVIIVGLLLSSSFFAAISTAGSEELPEGKAGTITFAAGGDHYNGAAFEAAMDTLVAANTDFYIANGDLGFTGPGNEQSWCDQVIAKVGSDYPFQLLSGNHDDDGSSDGEISGYVQCLPDHMNSVGTYGGQYYFDYPSASPLVRVIMLPADLTVFGVTYSYVQGDSHYNWVSSTIDDARTNNIPWVVVAMHKACITTGPKGSCEVGTDIFDLLMNKKVDLIFHGHVHTNERSKQLTCVVPDTYDPSCVVDDGSDDHYVKGEGPVIVIGGPMGQGTRSPDPGDSEAGYFAKLEGGSEGFYKYTVTENSIEAVFHASSGTHSDSFTIGPNDQPFTVGLSPDSDSANPGEAVSSTVRVNGISEVPVTLSSSGCPPDSTCTISPSSGMPPFTATLTVSTTGTTPLNTYPITVTGANGTRTDSDIFTLTVDQTVTRTFQKGDGGLYSEIEDTFIYDGAPDTNYGSDPELFMDGADCIDIGTVCKSLIKFPDFIGSNNGQIPTGVVVQSANLEFTVTNPGSPQDVYQVSESWEEMTATWNSFAVAGSPGIKLLSSTITPNTGRMSIDIIDIVQNWVNGDANQGILFDPTSGNGADLDSSESSNPEKLTVVYAPAGSNNFPSLDAPSVSPSSGTTSTTFTYQVKYSDIDNDAPAAGNPKVHISKGGNPISGSPFSMTHSSWVGAANDYVQGAIYTHARQLTSLGLDYSYHFTANDANGAGTSTTSEDAPDVTSGAGGASISFGAGGDLGWNSNTDATLNALSAAGTDFFLALGDFSYDVEGTESEWCALVKSYVGSAYPFELVSGDHEDDIHRDGWIGNFTQCLPDRMTSSGVYGAEYYFDYPAGDPLVRAIMITPDIEVLGSLREYRVGDSNYIWLSNTIDDARAQGIPWVVVGMHRNCITTGIKNCAIGTDLWDLLMDKKVDVVLQGNDHNYQRSKQLSCAVPDSYDPSCVVDDGSDNLYTKGAGSVLVITGNFGISLYPVDPADAEAGYFAQINSDTYGFTRFDVTVGRMDIRLVNSVGTFTDSFSIVSDSGGGGEPPADCMRIAIPSYFYPGALWDQATADAPATSIMIMNPSNGPGTSFDSAYGNAVTQAKAAGIKVLGYVYTLYTSRDAVVVKAEIDSYMNWYGVDGIFLDEVSNDAADIAYYQDLANYIRTKSGKFIMINPGTTTDEQYMGVSDVIVVFESSYSSYTGATFPSWMDNYPSYRFLHLVYDAPQASFANAWDLAKTRNAGYVYITDDTISNPWDSLPTYWDSEVAASDDSCRQADKCIPGALANGGFITAQYAQLNLDGQRIRIVGGNSYGILSEYLGAGHVTDLVPNALQRFQEAKSTNLKVIRFWLDIAPSDYWFDKSYGVYKSEPDHSTYFDALDALIADAAANGIRIVPVFASAFDQWTAEGGNTNFWIVGSQSNILFKAFVSEVVNRYKDDPRIAWWELANEPNYFSTIWLSKATHSELVAWATDLADFIRAIDSNHLIEGGYNNLGSLDMNKFDELNGFLDIASHHIYDVDLYALEAGKGITDRYSAVNDYVQMFTDRAKNVLGMPLLWGEYGADMIAEPMSPFHDWFLEAVYNHDSDASLVWSWEEGYTTDPHVVSLTFRPHVALNLSKWGGIMNTVFDDSSQSVVPEVCPPAVEDVKLNGILGSINVMPGTLVDVTARIDDTATGMSNITGANYTIGQSNWASSAPMNAADSSFDSPVEDVTSAPSSIDTALLGAGIFHICVYASDEVGNDNTTGACQALVVSMDSIEPAVTGFTINGQSALTVLQSSPPSDLILQASIDDTSRGDSKIAGANFTIGGDWAGAQLLDPVDGNFDSSIEGVSRTMPVLSAPGAHTFCVFGWDEWNNMNTTGQCAIVTVVDDVAPAISVVDSPDPQNSGGTVTFEATATDNVGISDVSINITDPIGSVMGNFSMNLDVPSGKWIYSSSFAELGTHTFVAWAKDTSNNWASTSGEFDIVQVQDTTPPTISSVQDSPDPQTSGGAVGFEAVVMDDVSVSEVWIEILDPTGFSTGNFTMGFDTPSGKWKYGSIFTAIGMHSYVVRAKDTSGNWASALGSFLIVQAIDTIPPTLTSVQDSPDPQEVGKVVDFRANIVDNVGVTSVMLDVGPGNYSMVYDPSSGEWLHSMTFDTAQLYAYSVWAYDAAGNVANGIGSTLIVEPAASDTTPPEVTMVSAYPSPQFKTEPVRISAIATDDDEVKSVYVRIVDKNGAVLGNVSMTHNGTSGMWERTLIFVNAGGYSFTIWAEDASGNFGWAPGALNIINSVSKGMIKGRIVDADGNPIADAKVTLLDGNGSTVTTCQTGNDGTYSMKDIEPGVYTIKILKSGYKTETTEEIVIGEGDTADLGSTMLLPELQNPASDGNLMLIILFFLVIVVVALILIALLYRRKKKKASRDY